MRLIFRLLGCSVLAGAAFVASAAAPSLSYTGLVIFGDSLSDSGNNFILPSIGADPAQVITGNGYVPTQTYAGSPFGVYSNGPVWATQFGALIGQAALPSLAGGTDYAFGGAVTSASDLTKTVPGLVDQAGMYFSDLATSGSTVSSTALYVVAGGGNNARDTLEAVGSNPAAAASIIGAAALQYASDVGSIVDGLQAAGAKHIIVWNTPNLGPVPAVSVLGPLSSLTGTSISSTFNQVLAARLAGEVGVQTFDIFSLVSEAKTSGLFTNTADACGAASNAAACGSDISKDLFWDGIHPTTAGHALIASRMYDLAAVTAPVPEPSELAMMLAGLLAVVGFARRKAA